MSYLDNPRENLDYLGTLKGKELETYVEGYILGLHHILESVNGGKLELLSYIMGLEKEKRQLYFSHVALFDAIEERIEERELLLSRLFPEIFEKDAK